MKNHSVRHTRTAVISFAVSSIIAIVGCARNYEEPIPAAPVPEIAPSPMPVETQPPVPATLEPAATPRPSRPAQSPFGMHQTRADKDMAPYAYAEELGVRIVRDLWFHWGVIQADPAVARYVWTAPLKRGPCYDALVRSIPASMSVLAIISPTGHTLRDSHKPTDVASYIRFVSATVERYDGDGEDDMPDLRAPIKYWQVHNEPEPKLKDYGELLKLTYRAIKDTDPGATVVIGAPVTGPNEGDFIANHCEPYYRAALHELTERPFDVLDLHFYGDARGDYRRFGQVYRYFTDALAKKGFPKTEVWVGEMGTYSGTPKHKIVKKPGRDVHQSEALQAADLLKRYVYPLSLGVKKIFFVKMVEGFQHKEGYFDMAALIFDGMYDHDRGRGVKKLAFFTYKLMVQKLEGSDWAGIETLNTGQPNVHAYRFPNRAHSPVIVAWWDWFEETERPAAEGVQVSLPFTGDKATITEAVTGRDGSVTVRKLAASGESLTLRISEHPVFIEKTPPPAN